MNLSADFTGAVSTAEELREVYDLVKEVLGPDLISFEQFADMHAANPNISHNIKRPDGSMCGFLSLSFLNAAAFDGLEQKTLQTLDLDGSHQADPKEIPRSIYVGAIGAVPERPARKAIVEYFEKVMAEYTA